MSMAMKVRMLLAARDISMTELGKRLEAPTTGQNISAKLRRDNFSEKELAAIAKACDAEFEGSFILNDSKKVI